MRVKASADQWSAFLRRCKTACPQEHCEAVWGEETVDCFRVTNFKRMKLEKRTASNVYYDGAEVKRQKWAAKLVGKVFLGTIHTHPGKDYDSSPTTRDHHEASLDGERIMGVINLYKKDNGRWSVETNWWFPQRKLEFDII